MTDGKPLLGGIQIFRSSLLPPNSIFVSDDVYELLNSTPEDAEAGYLGTSHAYDAWYKRDANGEVLQICPGAGFNDWVHMGGRKVFPVGSVRRPVKWNGPGDGLPPIGTAVEVDFHGDVEYLPDSLKGWVDGDEVVCIAHYAIQGGDHVLPIFFHKRLFAFSALRKDCYVPIRTPEQMAAEALRAKYMPQLIKLWDADTKRTEFLEAVYNLIVEASKP